MKHVPQPQFRFPKKRAPRGFSLLEVLVTVVVLSIGLLGTAALQVKGLQSAHSAYQRTVASIIATDGAERLWVAMLAGSIADPGPVQAAWLSHWQSSEITLPALDGSIAKSGSTYTITVTWGEGRFDDASGGVSSFEYIAHILPDKN